MNHEKTKTAIPDEQQLMVKEIIVNEIIEILKQYDLTYDDTKDILMVAIQKIGRSKIAL